MLNNIYVTINSKYIKHYAYLNYIILYYIIYYPYSLYRLDNLYYYTYQLICIDTISNCVRFIIPKKYLKDIFTCICGYQP